MYSPLQCICNILFRALDKQSTQVHTGWVGTKGKNGCVQPCDVLLGALDKQCMAACTGGGEMVAHGYLLNQYWVNLRVFVEQR